MKSKKTIIIYTCTIIIFVMILIIIFNNAVSKESLKFRWTNMHIVNELGCSGYFFYDIHQIIKEKLYTVSKEDVKEIRTYLKRFTHIDNKFIKNKNKNIVLLQLESVDGITLDLKLDNAPLMPNLRRIIEKSIYFPNTIDQSGVGKTSDGEFLALTSLLPIINDSMYKSYDLSLVPSLPKILTKNNYRTFSIHGFMGGFWGRDKAHKLLGYEKTYFMDNLVQDDIVGWGISDKSVMKQAVKIMKKEKKPFMAHIILLTNHHPYDHVEKGPFKKPSDIVENYINSIRYVDEAIGVLFELLEKENLLDDTMIMIFSDHDSAITSKIHEKFNLSYSDGFKDDKIPLIFYTGDEKYVNERLAGQADIAPLILEKLGIGIPFSMIGNSYLDSKQGVLLQNGEFIIKNDKEELVKENTNIDVSKLTRLILLKGEDINELK